MSYTDNDNRLKIPYVPVRTPRERLTALHDDSEWTIRLNPQYLALAVSALDIFAWHDSWLGTDTEIASQIGEVKEAQHALRENLIMVKDVTMPDNCTLRIESDDGAITNLDLSQCAGKVPAIRRDPITGDLQWWDGTSWEDMPGPPATEPTPDPNDPRFQGGDWEAPAPGTGIDVVCRAADSMIQALQLAASEVVGGIDWSNETWLSTFSIASAGLSSIAGLFSVFATGNPALGIGIGLSLYGYLDAVASEFLGLASSYSLSEAEDLASSLNSNWTDLRCLIYCNLDSDGQMSYEGWLNLMGEIDFQIDTLADPSWYEFIRPVVEMAGTDSLNAAYAEYQSTLDDCTTCACLHIDNYLGGYGLGDATINFGAWNETEDRIDGDCSDPLSDHLNSKLEYDYTGKNVLSVEFDVEWHATEYGAGGWDVTGAKIAGTSIPIVEGDRRASTVQGSRTVRFEPSTPTAGIVSINHQSKSLNCSYYSRITRIEIVWREV
jgi:hypothetical protein